MPRSFKSSCSRFIGSACVEAFIELSGSGFSVPDGFFAHPHSTILTSRKTANIRSRKCLLCLSFEYK